MESNDEFKKIDIKNPMSYYFHDIMTAEDIDSSDILLDKKKRKYFNF